MSIQHHEVKVAGMICRQCEDIICCGMNNVRGVVSCRASYWRETVALDYDSEWISPSELENHLSQIGYPVRAKRQMLLMDALTLLLLLVLLAASSFIHLPAVPAAEPGASYGYLFLIGLMTGTHCVTMCGGIQLSQVSGKSDAAKNWRSGLGRAVRYNTGRIILCTLLGILFGAFGGAFSYSNKWKSMVYTLGGATVLLFGLCMWGVCPPLRRLQTQLPSLCQMPHSIQRLSNSKPFLIGAITALMPCAASNAMWAYAVSTTSPLVGGLSMFCWSLGTVPCMLILGSLGAAASRKHSSWLMRINIALITAMGIKMLLRGIALFP